MFLIPFLPPSCKCIYWPKAAADEEEGFLIEDPAVGRSSVGRSRLDGRETERSNHPPLLAPLPPSSFNRRTLERTFAPFLPLSRPVDYFPVACEQERDYLTAYVGRSVPPPRRPRRSPLPLNPRCNTQDVVSSRSGRRGRLSNNLARSGKRRVDRQTDKRSPQPTSLSSAPPPEPPAIIEQESLATNPPSWREGGAAFSAGRVKKRVHGTWEGDKCEQSFPRTSVVLGRRRRRRVALHVLRWGSQMAEREGALLLQPQQRAYMGAQGNEERDLSLRNYRRLAPTTYEYCYNLPSVRM